MVEKIAITIQDDILKYVDEKAEKENRSRSNMITTIIKREKEKEQ